MPITMEFENIATDDVEVLKSEVACNDCCAVLCCVAGLFVARISRGALIRFFFNLVVLYVAPGCETPFACGRFCRLAEVPFFFVEYGQMFGPARRASSCV